jgi:hypothetical protein
MRMTAMARMTPTTAAGDRSVGVFCVGAGVRAGMKVHTGAARMFSQRRAKLTMENT